MHLNKSVPLTLFIAIFTFLSSISLCSSFASPSNRLPQELPSITASNKSNLETSSYPPKDLVKLAAVVKKSLVTITCGNKLGSGWSAKFSKPSSGNGNFGAYIITNYHVVSSCLDSNVEITLNNGEKINGTVFSWDDSFDLAGIYTLKNIPQLDWQGSLPEQGMWNGVFGSPLGISGTLTTGIVSNIESVKYFGTTTAPINPGNSGGPVFDREGRVLGIATAKYVNSEGFGIFQGTPLLCVKIFNCPIGTNAWYGKAAFDISQAPNPLTVSNIQFAPVPESSSFAAGMLNCYFAPTFSNSFISQFNINGVYISIFDLTTNKLVTSNRIPIPVSTNDRYLLDTENGRYISNRLPSGPDSMIFIGVLKAQKQDHKYQCSAGIVANNLIGELSAEYANAKTSGDAFKALPWKKPSASLIKKSIICQKGSVLKIVTAINPKCPAGFKPKK